MEDATDVILILAVGGDFLNFSAADNGFDVLGQLSRTPQPQVTAWLFTMFPQQEQMEMPMMLFRPTEPLLALAVLSRMWF